MKDLLAAHPVSVKVFFGNLLAMLQVEFELLEASSGSHLFARTS